VITSLESMTSENEAKRVKLQDELDKKHQIFEENLEKLSEQEKELNQGIAAQEMSITKGYTEMFDKIKT